MMLTQGEITGISHAVILGAISGLGVWMNNRFSAHSTDVKLILNGDLADLAKEVRALKASMPKNKRGKG